MNHLRKNCPCHSPKEEVQESYTFAVQPLGPVMFNGVKYAPVQESREGASWEKVFEQFWRAENRRYRGSIPFEILKDWIRVRKAEWVQKSYENGVQIQKRFKQVHGKAKYEQARTLALQEAASAARSVKVTTFENPIYNQGAEDAAREIESRIKV